VRWLACVVDPESYAGGSLATARVTHAGGETPDQEEHPGPSGENTGYIPSSPSLPSSPPSDEHSMKCPGMPS
ncbi:hypothetical protein JTE90_019710, partial [Oedothorax gibbosus]